jgi:hypothetical protein
MNGEGKNIFYICRLLGWLEIMEKICNKIMSFALSEVCITENVSNLLTELIAFPANLL